MAWTISRSRIFVSAYGYIKEIMSVLHTQEEEEEPLTETGTVPKAKCARKQVTRSLHFYFMP